MRVLRPWLHLLVATCLLVGWFGSLLLLRARLTGHVEGIFLLYNLFLAGIPLATALLLEVAQESRFNAGLQLILWPIWLAFLPNAPYVITDLVHLRPRPPVPLWFDVVLLGSAAAAGLWLGYLAVSVAQRVVARSLGPAAGWFVASTGLLLSGVGIYLGRFLRWNSWDLLFNPRPIAAHFLGWLLNPRAALPAIAVVVIYGGGLLLGYLALRVLLIAMVHPEASRSAA